MNAWVIFTAVNAALVLLLALNVSRLRMQYQIPYGDGGNKAMNQAIRAHANAVEHGVWMALLLLALSANHGGAHWVAGLGLAYTLSRLLHAYGMLGRHFNARRLGAAVSYLAQLVAIIVLLLLVWIGSE